MYNETTKTEGCSDVIQRATLSGHINGAAGQLDELREIRQMIYELSSRLSGSVPQRGEDPTQQADEDTGLSGRLADIVGDTAGVVVDIRHLLKNIHESL